MVNKKKILWRRFVSIHIILFLIHLFTKSFPILSVGFQNNMTFNYTYKSLKKGHLFCFYFISSLLLISNLSDLDEIEKNSPEMEIRKYLYLKINKLKRKYEYINYLVEYPTLFLLQIFDTAFLNFQSYLMLRTYLSKVEGNSHFNLGSRKKCGIQAK